jgi:hypothetical protein
VLFADGGKFAMGTSPIRPPSGSDPLGPVLNHYGEGGSSHQWRHNIWLWPLPPPGPLAFVFAWPDKDIPESRVVLDGGDLVAAANDAVKLWDIDPKPGPIDS